jgi:hypothetical protein
MLLHWPSKMRCFHVMYDLQGQIPNIRKTSLGDFKQEMQNR